MKSEKKSILSVARKKDIRVIKQRNDKDSFKKTIKLVEQFQKEKPTFSESFIVVKKQ